MSGFAGTSAAWKGPRPLSITAAGITLQKSKLDAVGGDQTEIQAGQEEGGFQGGRDLFHIPVIVQRLGCEVISHQRAHTACVQVNALPFPRPRSPSQPISQAVDLGPGGWFQRLRGRQARRHHHGVAFKCGAVQQLLGAGRNRKIHNIRVVTESTYG